MFSDKEFMGLEITERRLEILKNAFGKIFQKVEVAVRIKRDSIDSLPFYVLKGIVESIEKKHEKCDFFHIEKLFASYNGTWVHGEIYYNCCVTPIQLPIAEVIHILDKFEIISVREKL